MQFIESDVIELIWINIENVSLLLFFAIAFF